MYDTEEKRKLTRTEAKQLTDELTAEEFTNRVKPVSNTYTVFNGEQIDGIPLYEIRKNVLHLDEFLYGRNKHRKSEIIRDAEKISMTYSDAATFRMAMKGQERALDMFMNDESIPEYIKNDSMAIGKEAEKYFNEGLSIGEVIMNHTQDIDNSCNIFNPAYTKNLLSGLYAKTNEEYREPEGTA